MYEHYILCVSKCIIFFIHKHMVYIARYHFPLAIQLYERRVCTIWDTRNLEESTAKQPFITVVYPD